MKTNLFKEMKKLRKHDDKLASRIEQGKHQLITVVYDVRGISHVCELSDYLEYNEFVQFLVDFKAEVF